MKLNVGIDSKSKLIHSMTTTAANVHDATLLGFAGAVVAEPGAPGPGGRPGD
jgi:IS5 family transposase